MGVTATATLAVAIGLDSLFEEFPATIHPVAVFGSLVESVDRDWPWPRLFGTVVALTFPLGAAGLAAFATAFTISYNPYLGVLVAGLALFSAISLRMLLSTAREVRELIDTDVDAARTSIAALVGRDGSQLSPGELRSAVVESLGENFADGLLAPLVAFAIGAQFALWAGVGAAVWVKAVNTLDSMLGYPSKPHGWASARLDDAVMWIPARLSALVLLLTAHVLGALNRSTEPLEGATRTLAHASRALTRLPRVRGTSPGTFARARAWAQEPPSPNSGWPMATLAAVLDVKLSKPGVYTLNPRAELPTRDHVDTALEVVTGAGILTVVLVGGIVWF